MIVTCSFRSSQMTNRNANQLVKVLTAVSIYDANITRGKKGVETQPSPTTQCDVNNLSNIPKNVFDGPQNNVYHQFCDKWAAGTEPIMTVDAKGNNKDAEGQLRSLRRTPPANADAYTHYNINLGFKPSDSGNECVQDCADAFSQIGSACSNTGAQDQFMQSSGSLDVECGVFDYNIAKTIPPELQERHCYGADEFGSHGDIHGWRLDRITTRVCSGLGDAMIKRGDPSTNIAARDDDNGQPVQLNIYWEDNCVIDYPNPDEVDAGLPLGKTLEGNIRDAYCKKLFTDNWGQCNNGGAGGSIQAGCIVYEFKAKGD
ncbi:hypothetical protein GGR58DRAFT_518848 [Xylaria digitata]|nr:hypothetical protein GGR58DRAFT_518848 [Xylaria digitata]